MGALGAASRVLLKVPLAVPGGKHTLPPAGRRRGQLIVVYHNADRAGPHAEMYLYDPHGSKIAHNIGVIKLAQPVKLNSSGWVTEDEKERIRKLIVAKGTGRDWIAFSTDHQEDEAKASWSVHEDGPQGYGAGSLRQVIYVEDVEIYSNGSTVEFTSWWLNGGVAPCYVHVVFPKNNDRESTVGVIGFRKLSEPKFDDRLHLVSDGNDKDKFLRNIGPDGHAAEKIDGASTNFVSDKTGTRYFSPRHSKETGRRIEYSAKMGSLQDITSEETIKGMGEITFVDTRTGETLSAAEIGGELNAHRIPPEHLEVRIYVYRIDSVGRRDCRDEPAWPDNRTRCEGFAARHASLHVPQEVPLTDLDRTRSGEGAVGVRRGAPITEGRKLKWRDDEDVVVTEVAFKPGPTGKVAGVVWYEDSQGHAHKTASGWTEAEKQEMMASPEQYEGRVMKISGFNGHSSRGARFEAWHDSKGVA